MGDNSQLLIEVKKIKTYFYLPQGIVRSVDNASFDISRGKTLGVVGESGCGKSVTAQSILRIVPTPGKIVSGEILYHQVSKDDPTHSVEEVIDLAKMDWQDKKLRAIRGAEIAMIFQEPMTSLSVIHTIGNQIEEAIVLHQHLKAKEARERAIEMLTLVGISQPEKNVDEYPFRLSGGMRQRAMIAMALSCHPHLLIADEPTTALDVTTEAQILDLMRKLQADLGMSIMFITHDLGVVAEMANDVVVMYLGRVVENASVIDLFHDPKHPYTQALLNSIPKLTSKSGGRLEPITGYVPDPYTQLPGCPFHPRCPKIMSGVCDVIPPELIQVAPDHWVSCHLYTEGK
ncbi:MAG: ABC transporter ATP-binding protein [Anaerolineaceae bacterium]|nr:ABC transporter ATP-binding protein [Anaerolineaceae bacterium]